MSASTGYSKIIPTPVTVPNGGTGLATLTTGNLLVGAGTGNVTFIAPGTGVAAALAINIGDSGSIVEYEGDAGEPSYISLANGQNLPLGLGVTGTLPLTNGGLGVTTMPKVSAYKSSDQAHAGGSYTKVTFNTEEYDTNSNFASSTFTAPRTGYFRFTGSVYCGSSSVTIAVALYENGSQIKRLASGTSGNSANTQIFAGSAAVYCTSGNTYEIYCYAGSAATLAGASSTTFFQIEALP